MASAHVVEIYRPSFVPYRAIVQLRMNIEHLLFARKEDQKTLALYMGRHPTTLNKFLKGTRELQFQDLDKIADFFGIATYQLFQPGISMLSERRHGERRKSVERRIGHGRSAFPAEKQLPHATPLDITGTAEPRTHGRRRRLSATAELETLRKQNAALSAELDHSREVLTKISRETGVTASGATPRGQTASPRPKKSGRGPLAP